MSIANRWLLLSCALLLGALAPLRAPLRAADQDPLVLVASAQGELKDLSLSELRRAYEGYPVEYASGKRVIPFNLPSGTPDRAHFDRELFGMTPDEMARFWVDQRIRGQSQQPRALASPELAVRVVAALQGAVAYVRASTLNPTVRVLTIDGKTSETPGYPLAP
ncbi:MAG: hypothetical protein ABW252_23590 [Polyangiales bacterium]